MPTSTRPTHADGVADARARRRRRWIPVVVAALLVVMTAGGSAALATDRPGDLTDVAHSVAVSKHEPGRAAAGEVRDLLVRDGDQVAATGRLIAEQGKPPVLCPLLPQLLTSGVAAARACPAQYAVVLRNFDLTQSAGARVVTVTGTWKHRSIDVRTQEAAQVRSTTQPRDRVPCPAPAGGWSTAPNVIDDAAISRFLAAHADQIADPSLLYPEGRLAGAPEVYTIGVAHGDPAEFRRTFEKVYAGNLCVHRVRFSRSELTRMATAVSELIPRGLGVYAAGPAAQDKVSVSALVYDEVLQNALAPIGPDTVDLVVTVRPLR